MTYKEDFLDKSNSLIISWEICKTVQQYNYRDKKNNKKAGGNKIRYN